MNSQWYWLKLSSWDAAVIWLNDRVSSNVESIVAAPIWHIHFLTLPPLNGDISALELATDANEVSRKNMVYNGMQYNTPHFQITPEIYGFQNIPNFL